jgi:hypothetical protein
MYIAVPPGRGKQYENLVWHREADEKLKLTFDILRSPRSGDPNFGELYDLHDTPYCDARLRNTYLFDLASLRVLKSADGFPNFDPTKHLSPQDLMAHLQAALYLLESGTFSILQAVRDREISSDYSRGLNPRIKNASRDLLDYAQTEVDLAIRILKELAKLPRNGNCTALSPENFRAQFLQYPAKFAELLLSDYNHTRHDGTARGDTHVYSSSPNQFAQRISTMASAAEAIQVAMALSALVPQAGAKINTSLGQLNYGLGKAEARERLPIAVGFSGQRSIDNNKASSHFGWIFGPEVVLDPSAKQLKLEHGLVNHQVSAEISVPAWWPRIKLAIETAWIHNWYASSSTDLFEASSPVRRETKEVYLPSTRADLETLTYVLATQTIGRPQRRIKIDRVIPQKIALCGTKRLTLLVYGRDVWKTTKAFLAGVPLTDIQILPDMEGISVVLDPGAIPRIANSFEPQLLTVSTRNGTDAIPVSFTGTRDPDNCGIEAIDLTGPIVQPVSPLDPCGQNSSILFKGKDLTETIQGTLSLVPGTKVYLGTLQGQKVRAVDNNLILAEFNSIPDSLLRKPVLTVVNKKGVTSVPIDVTPTRKECKSSSGRFDIISVHTQPIGPVNVCNKGTATFIAQGHQLADIESADLEVHFDKNDNSTLKATSQIIHIPEEILELEFTLPIELTRKTKVMKNADLVLTSKTKEVPSVKRQIASTCIPSTANTNQQKTEGQQ